MGASAYGAAVATSLAASVFTGTRVPDDPPLNIWNARNSRTATTATPAAI
jgi:hypothetical protein